MRTQTTTATEWWAAPRGVGAAAWAARYWGAIDQPHRRAILSALDVFPDAQSLMEVGCHAGPNLRLIAGTHPDWDLLGLDASCEAVDAGRGFLAAAHLDRRVHVYCGVFPCDTQQLDSAVVDLVLASYVLAYIAPHELDAALYELGRLARLGIVLAEPMRSGETEELHRTSYLEWRHDYIRRVPWIQSLQPSQLSVVSVAPGAADGIHHVLAIKKTGACS